MMRGLVDDWMAPTHWQRDGEQMGGDIFAGVCAHAVDAMLWLAQSRPVEVVGFKPRNDVSSSAILTAQARLANDVLLSITFTDRINEGDSEFGFYGNARTTVIGDCGMLFVDSSAWGVQSAKEAWLERNGVRELVPVEGPEISPAAAFVASVLDGVPNLCNAEEGAQTVALIQSAYRSAAEGRIVPVLNPVLSTSN
jgi:predicted dehydrogenase